MRSLGLVVCCLATAASGWLNSNVERKLDLSNAIVRSTTTVTAFNNEEATDEYLFVVPESNVTRIAKLSVKVDKQEIPITETSRKGGNVYYTAKLKTKIANKASVTLKLRRSMVNSLRPFPPVVKQGESQFVDYNDNVYFLSPYATGKQTTTAKLASGTVESYSKVPPPVIQRGDTIVFGEYKEVEPMKQGPLRVHFMNNKPFMKAVTLRRVIEVSMWGNLAVEEWYAIENHGAKLKGTFSRLDYKRPGHSAPSSFTSLHAHLPQAATDIYFRDDIGNISTSTVGHADRSSKTREVIFTQRFPLFGGWKTRFYFGYNLPLEHALTHNGAENKLTVPFASPVKDLWVDDMVVEVILPEGVPVPEVKVGGKVITDFDVEYRSTYLDYSGRTVIVLKDSTLASPERSEELQVTFKFGTKDLLWEPIYLMVAFMTLFSSIIFFSRVLG
eukprot:TRINITY_DN14841_c0_g1_i1.p1 TRINITY_DN14841_c0_g1~~TRINITY_DN14841_c0_g1_i1.p1  ORF type:complete len:444 (+),score=132.32 TRINITY_DN14841_c0_g1_i1:54-1385(+)